MLRGESITAPVVATLTGTLEIVDVSCDNSTQLNVTESDTVVVADSLDQQQAPVDFRADDAPSMSNVNNFQYYLITVDSSEAITRSRLFFPAGMEPSAEIGSGWSAMVQGRPAVLKYSDPCSDEASAVPSEDTSAGANVATSDAILVDYWEPLGAPVTAQSWSPSVGTWSVKTITFILKFPTTGMTATPVSVGRLWFNSKASSTTASTLERFWSTCSYNQYSFAEADQLIVPTQIPVPATGVSANGRTWSTSSCSDVDRAGWAEFAENYVRNSMGLNPSAYRHAIFLVNNPACGIADVSTMACDYCRNYVNTNGGQPNVGNVFHSLGHNFWLNHGVGSSGGELTDISDAMGSWQGIGIRCPNTPHSAQIGWSKPVVGGVIDAVALSTPGRWYPYTVPSGSIPVPMNQNHLQIRPQSWTSRTAPIYYVGYRTSNGIDVTLDASVKGKVSIYQFNSTSSMSTERSRFFRAMLPGDTFIDTTNRFRVRTTATAATAASVSVCRFVTSETECP